MDAWSSKYPARVVHGLRRLLLLQLNPQPDPLHHSLQVPQTHQLRLFMSITLTLSGDFEEVFLTFTQNAGMARYNLDEDDAVLEIWQKIV